MSKYQEALDILSVVTISTLQEVIDKANKYDEIKTITIQMDKILNNYMSGFDIMRYDKLEKRRNELLGIKGDDNE